jgi:hypothetical protein
MGPFVILACEKYTYPTKRAETKMTFCAPKLVPIQPPTPIGPLRPQSHADDVAPGPGLAHRQAAHLLPSNQVGQVLCLLLLRPVPVDLVHAQIRVCAVRERHRARRAGQFLHGDEVLEIPQAQAPVIRRRGDSEQAHVT